MPCCPRELAQLVTDVELAFQVSVIADQGQLAFLPAVLPSGVLAANEGLELLSKSLEMSSFAPDDLNELSLILRTNADIPVGASIIVSGFQGAASPPDLIPAPGAADVSMGNRSLGMPGLIPLRRQSPAVFTGNSTRWDPAAGTLTFEAAAGIPARTELRFSLCLRNPAPNLERSQPLIELVSPFFTLPRQPLDGPPFRVDTLPPTLLSLTLSSYSSATASVRSANLSLLLTEPSQAVCLLQRASARVPSVDAVRSKGVHVQPMAAASSNLSDVGLVSAPRLQGWPSSGQTAALASIAFPVHARCLPASVRRLPGCE